MPTIPAHLPTRWHDAETIRQGGRDHYCPAGFFADWTDDTVRAAVYEARLRRPRPTARQIAAEFGLQHPVRVYRAYDAWARRIDRPAFRGDSIEHRDNPETGERRDPRSWARRSREAAIAADYRTWAVEIEFDHAEDRLSRSGVLAACQAVQHEVRAEFNHGNRHANWLPYHSGTDHRRWTFMHDCSVAGEVVQPVATQDSDFEDLRTIMAAMRSAGAYGSARQGLHTNIGCGDFAQDDFVRLIRNCANTAEAMRQYTPRSRHNNHYSASYSAAQWQSMIAEVERGGTPYGRAEVNFAHMRGPAHSARIEFRQFGHSMNFTKTRVWVQVCRALVTASKNGHDFTDGLSPEQFTHELRTHGGLSAWAAERFVRRANNIGRTAAAA